MKRLIVRNRLGKQTHGVASMPEKELKEFVDQEIELGSWGRPARWVRPDLEGNYPGEVLEESDDSREVEISREVSEVTETKEIPAVVEIREIPAVLAEDGTELEPAREELVEVEPARTETVVITPYQPRVTVIERHWPADYTVEVVDITAEVAAEKAKEQEKKAKKLTRKDVLAKADWAENFDWDKATAKQLATILKQLTGVVKVLALKTLEDEE